MKKTILTIAIGLIFYNCKAQSPIISLEDWDGSEQNNAYYKDTNNTLNDFEGIWLYTNGNTTLKIILVKNTQYFNGNFYEDTIVGGYQYIENGTEKINTLSDVNNPNLGFSASIDGNLISNNCKYLIVDDCEQGEKHLNLSITDVLSDGHVGDLILFKRSINGQEALKANIIMDYLLDVNDELTTPTLPWKMENIIMIKQ